MQINDAKFGIKALNILTVSSSLEQRSDKAELGAL